ncbi:hypothetical protein H0H93_010366, partial [Arthromyces matolae]
ADTLNFHCSCCCYNCANVPNIDPSTVKLGSCARKPQKTTPANKKKEYSCCSSYVSHCV